MEIMASPTPCSGRATFPPQPGVDINNPFFDHAMKTEFGRMRGQGLAEVCPASAPGSICIVFVFFFLHMTAHRASWKVAVLTVSDRASQGMYVDGSGPALLDKLKYCSWADTNNVSKAMVVPDNVDKIRAAIRQLKEECNYGN